MRRLGVSAGFDFAGQDYWGINCAVEAYLETLARIAAERLGPGDPMAIALSDESDGFFTGKVVFVDDILHRPGDRQRFVPLLDAATDQLLREDVFTDYGRRWVATIVQSLRDRLAAPDPAESGD
ncbi:hypothetical protein [Aquisphaera giovannonii]|uniref:hypothetical protein n=1 Tax=Aquisphaera giovannonii TaxID=406548 RepID=UPI0011E05B26|nr:hypothetical protein [Aquisphaera giovannonii]